MRQMARNLSWIMTGAAGLLLATSAFADIPLPSGWYIEGNAGASRSNDANYGAPTSNSSNGLGFNFNAGYRFMPYFGVEIGFTRYANASAKYNGTKVANDSRYSYDLAGKGILPLNDTGAEIFAKLGAARISSHVSEQNGNFVAANNLSINSGTHTTTGYYFGLGGDYAFTPNLAGVVQWQRAKGDSNTGNLDLYSVGITCTFN